MLLINYWLILWLMRLLRLFIWWCICFVCVSFVCWRMVCMNWFIWRLRCLVFLFVIWVWCRVSWFSILVVIRDRLCVWLVVCVSVVCWMLCWMSMIVVFSGWLLVWLVRWCRRCCRCSFVSLVRMWWLILVMRNVCSCWCCWWSWRCGWNRCGVRW